VGPVWTSCYQDVVMGFRWQIRAGGQDDPGIQMGAKDVEGNRIRCVEQVNMQGVWHAPFYAIPGKKLIEMIEQ
jgi:hypothetical protein